MKHSKLKPSKLAIATSLALAALSGQAMAVAPATNTVPQIDIFLSGASAPQNTLGSLAALLFGANTIIANVNQFNNYHVLYDTGSLGTDHRGYYGQLVGNFTINGRTLSAGTTVLLTNRARGGSVHGVNPIGSNPLTDIPPGPNASPFPIATTRPSATVSVITGCTAVPVVANQAYNHTCTVPTTAIDGVVGPNTRRPDFGVSDVAPFMFKSLFNKEPGTNPIFDPLKDAELANLKITPVFLLQFGVPATNSVPATLTLGSNPVTGFTKAMYSALLSAGIVDWNQINTGAALTGNTGVVVCRRSQGSGTQATYNAYFNNWPCTVNSVIPNSNTAPTRMENSADLVTGVDPVTGRGTITINPASGYTVVENPSSGNVRDCLWRAQTNQNHSYTWFNDAGDPISVTVLFGNGNTNPFRAIGTLSNDSVEGNNGAGTVPANNGHWTFRNLNDVPGVVAGLANKAAVRTGNWDFAAEVTMQYRTDGYITKTAIPSNTYPNQPLAYAIGDFVPFSVDLLPTPAIEKDRRAFIDLFIERSGDPTILNSISNTSTRAASLAIPGIYNPNTNANVAFVTRGGNMCAPNQWLGF